MAKVPSQQQQSIRGILTRMEKPENVSRIHEFEEELNDKIIYLLAELNIDYEVVNEFIKGLGRNIPEEIAATYRGPESFGPQEFVNLHNAQRR